MKIISSLKIRNISKNIALRKNGEIRSAQVLVIGPEGQKYGTLPIERAEALAQEHELDLVEIAPTAVPPVCKIMDYGKYLYQQEKKERKQRASQKKVDIKGIRLTLKMGEHDLDVRRKQTNKFLEAGHKVKVELILRGREKAHFPLALERIKLFKTTLAFPTAWEQEIKAMGGRISAVLNRVTQTHEAQNQ